MLLPLRLKPGDFMKYQLTDEELECMTEDELKMLEEKGIIKKKKDGKFKVERKIRTK